MKNLRIVFLQPIIPHYREDFFKLISQLKSIKIFKIDKSVSNKLGFKFSFFPSYYIGNFFLGEFLFYNPIPLIQNSDVIVLMLDSKHITTWVLLLTKKIIKKKIILWGHGTSIPKFLIQEINPSYLTKLMLELSDGAWFYTENELSIWKKRLPNLNAVSLNNTISGLPEILKYNIISSKEKFDLKEKYNIVEPIILIFCARFNTVRRVDLLLDVIQKVNSKKIGFVIIGSGNNKPSFINYSNVYDFGELYDYQIKSELFRISDIYFQPAWLGLSIVEAMAYGKPIFSFRRNISLHQCVEYFYVKNNFNGKIFENSNELISYLEEIDGEEVFRLGQNAKLFVRNNLSMNSMVINALSIL